MNFRSTAAGNIALHGAIAAEAAALLARKDRAQKVGAEKRNAESDVAGLGLDRFREQPAAAAPSGRIGAAAAEEAVHTHQQQQIYIRAWQLGSVPRH